MVPSPAFRRAAAALAPDLPTIAARAPGRVNLIGEHTDYNAGLVMPAAIQLDCVALGLPALSGLEILAVDLDESFRIELGEAISPEHPLAQAGTWTAYALGVLAHFQARPGRPIDPRQSRPRDPPTNRPALPPLRIAIACDVPLGAGLSSSAAFEVALCTLLHAAIGRSNADIASLGFETADACRRCEHEFARVPCGPMDQLVSVFARRGHALRIDCRDLSLLHVPLPTDAAFIVCDSGVHHALAAGEYARRREACESAARILGVHALRGATMDLLNRARGLNDEERRCARHVIEENQRVLDFVAAMRDGALTIAGAQMNASHASLASDFRVSCDEVDELVRFAQATPGVLGSRMTGAGFGGCTVTLCVLRQAPRVLHALTRHAHEINPHARNPFVVVASPGAQRIDPRAGEPIA